MYGNGFRNVILLIFLSIIWFFFTFYIAYPDGFIELFQSKKIDSEWWDNIYGCDLELIKRGHFTILFLAALDVLIRFIINKVDTSALGVAYTLLFLGIFCEAIVENLSSILMLLLIAFIVVSMKFISLWEIEPIETELI